MAGFVSVNWSTPENFIYLSGLLFFIVFLRYTVLSGAYHWFFLIHGRKRYRKRLLNEKLPDKKQMIKEIKWSGVSSLVFAVSGTIMVVMWQNGYTSIYTDLHAFSLLYLPVSLIAAMLIHETYYYWLHRWMHKPKIYRLIHKVHHDSIKTSSWTSFSFHPVESILQALIIPLIIIFLPMHVVVLLFMLVLMTVSAIVNHAGIEVYSGTSTGIKSWRWLIGAVHHDLHHRQFRYNFGLYFTFWDRWMHTESPDFEIIFKNKTSTNQIT